LCAACRARMAAGERRNVITVVFAHIVWALDRSERLDPESVRWAVQRWFERGGRGWWAARYELAGATTAVGGRVGWDWGGASEPS
jgi:hypothetical protein